MPPDEAWWKKFARVGVGLLICLPLGGIMLLFFLLDIENAYVLMIFGSLLPAICIGFIFFFITDYTNKRIGLLVIKPRGSLNQVDDSLAEGGNYE